MAQLDLFAVHIVDVSLEAGVVSHQAVTAEDDVFPLEQTRGPGLLEHVSLLEWDEATLSGNLLINPLLE